MFLYNCKKITFTVVMVYNLLLRISTDDYDVPNKEYEDGLNDADALGYGSKAIKSRTSYWPNGDIPYKIDSSVADASGVIRAAIAHWMENVCLTFHEEENITDTPFIVFKKTAGCNSPVGRQWWKPEGQTISVGTDCDVVGTIAHEIGHAIGFHHEHSRPDRDNYVKILDNNIDPKHVASFKKRSDIDMSTYKIPYDLESLMHYGPKTFPKNDGNTIVSLDPMKHFLLGQTKGLSFYDKKLANLMYDCNKNCDSEVQCLNDGYVDKSCMCICPPGFNGSSCEIELPKEESECGGVITEPTTLLSPKYPEKYPRSMRCIWWIKATNGSIIRATFKDFELINRLKAIGKCKMDQFELRKDDIYDGISYCGTELLEQVIDSSSTDMVFLFSSGKLLTKRGFNITIEFHKAE